jgi:hypothetical protein
VSRSDITVQRNVRTITVSRGGAAPVSVYRQATRTVQIEQSSRGLTGNTGPQGPQGWAPVFGVVANGLARVLQLMDWTGGEGTKPAILSGGLPQYVSATGFTTTIGSAADLGPVDPNALAYVIALG